LLLYLTRYNNRGIEMAKYRVSWIEKIQVFTMTPIEAESEEEAIQIAKSGGADIDTDPMNGIGTKYKAELE
jgi:hypothetical protein